MSVAKDTRNIDPSRVKCCLLPSEQKEILAFVICQLVWDKVGTSGDKGDWDFVFSLAGRAGRQKKCNQPSSDNVMCTTNYWSPDGLA